MRHRTTVLALHLRRPLSLAVLPYVRLPDYTVEDRTFFCCVFFLFYHLRMRLDSAFGRVCVRVCPVRALIFVHPKSSRMPFV